MEYYNGIHCVTGFELIKSEVNPAGVMTKDNYDKLSQRGRIRVIRRSCYERPSLIEWRSLPEKYKKKLREIGIHPKEKDSLLKRLIDVDIKAREFFTNFLLPDGRYLPENKMDEYIANAEVLNAISKLVSDKKLLRRALGGSTRNIWPNIVEKTAALRPKYDNNGELIKEGITHTLPDNHRRLSERFSKYNQGSYLSLISGKWLNVNAKKVVDPEQEATLRELLRKHQNFDNVQVADLYNLIADKVEWSKISPSTVANYRKKWNLEIFGGRYGESAFDNTRAMLVKRKSPTLPLVYWTVDGWDVELLYQKRIVDKNGHSKVTYHNRLTVVIVLDPSQKYPIGYAVGTHETPALIREALRNAVNHSAELFGVRHRVGQLQTDNYGKKNLLPFYEAISEKFTPAKAYNSKAKVIEPYFKRLNKKYCQLMPNWSGFGITSRKESQPNADYLNKIKHAFPDEQGCRLQINHIINLERQAVENKYIESYKELPEAERLTLSQPEYLHLLGEVTGYTNRLTAMGVVASIAGERREYDTFDPEFRKLAHVDWTLKFDPSTPDIVLAESNDGTQRFMLEQKHVQPMALRDRAEGDAEQLKLVRGFNREMKDELIEIVGNDHALVESVFDNNPALNDTLAKFVLTDSNGQHKDNKSQARLASAKKDASNWEDNQAEYLKEKIDINKYM